MTKRQSVERDKETEATKYIENIKRQKGPPTKLKGAPFSFVVGAGPPAVGASKATEGQKGRSV